MLEGRRNKEKNVQRRGSRVKDGHKSGRQESDWKGKGRKNQIQIILIKGYDGELKWKELTEDRKNDKRSRFR